MIVVAVVLVVVVVTHALPPPSPSEYALGSSNASSAHQGGLGCLRKGLVGAGGTQVGMRHGRSIPGAWPEQGAGRPKGRSMAPSAMSQGPNTGAQRGAQHGTECHVTGAQHRGPTGAQHRGPTWGPT